MTDETKGRLFFFTIAVILVLATAIFINYNVSKGRENIESPRLEQYFGVSEDSSIVSYDISPIFVHDEENRVREKTIAEAID